MRMEDFPNKPILGAKSLLTFSVSALFLLQGVWNTSRGEGNSGAGRPYEINALPASQPDRSAPAAQDDFYTRLSDAAIGLTRQNVRYDPSYFRIPYPNGDVPADRGVCTDVIIRAYRKLGIDLQKEVHLDMKANFGKYPDNWGLSRPDTNIDHRRVPNLMVFFSRFGTVLPISDSARDYRPGDIVCWSLGGGLTHIGIVSGRKASSGRYLIVHNIGAGQVLQDCLFDYTVIGHYRYKK